MSSKQESAIKKALRILRAALESPVKEKKCMTKNTACPEKGAILEKRKPAFLP